MSTTIIRSPSIGDHRTRLPSGGHAFIKDEPTAETELSRLERILREQMQQDMKGRLEQLAEMARQEGFAKGLLEGRAAGHAEGFAEGQATGKADWEAKLQRLDGILAESELAIRRYWQQTTDTVEDLTLKSICLLLGEHALQTNVIVGLVKQAMGMLQEGDVLKVRLHPSEHQVLLEAVGAGDHAAKLSLGRLSNRIVSDPSLALGGCIVETPRGEYCGSLDVQLSRLHKALHALRSSAPTGHLRDGAARA